MKSPGTSVMGQQNPADFIHGLISGGPGSEGPGMNQFGLKPPPRPVTFPSQHGGIQGGPGSEGAGFNPGGGFPMPRPVVSHGDSNGTPMPGHQGPAEFIQAMIAKKQAQAGAGPPRDPLAELKAMQDGSTPYQPQAGDSPLKAEMLKMFAKMVQGGG